MNAMPDTFMLADVPLQSRFLLGTAGYPSPQVLREAIAASGAQVVGICAGGNDMINIAKQMGEFEKENLDVQFEVMPSSDSLPLLAAQAPAPGLGFPKRKAPLAQKTATSWIVD